MPAVETARSKPPPPPPPPITASAEASEASPPRPWGTGRVFGGILILLVLVSIEAALVSIFDPDLKSLAAKLVLQAMLAVTLVAVSFAMASTHGRRVEPWMLGLRAPLAGWWKLALQAYAAYFAFALAYSAIVSPHQKDLTRDLGYGHNVAISILVGLLVVLVAPISEEIFFRGFVFGGLRNRLTWVWAAVISAAIFGAFHFTGASSLGVLPQLAFLGLALAWLYQRSGSILPTMAVHLVNNAIAFALLTH